MQLIDIGRYIEFEINGETYKFHKFTPRMQADVLRDMKAADRKLRVDSLQLAGITGEAMANELYHYDVQPWTDFDFARHVCGFEWQDVVYRRSLERTYGDKADEMLDRMTISVKDSIPLIAGICGLRVNEPEPTTKATVEEEPRPSAGAPSAP